MNLDSSFTVIKLFVVKPKPIIICLKIRPAQYFGSLDPCDG